MSDEDFVYGINPTNRSRQLKMVFFFFLFYTPHVNQSLLVRNNLAAGRYRILTRLQFPNV